MAWVGWDLKVHLVLTPLPWAGSPFTGLCSQSAIQPGLEAHPGTRHMHSFSWQPVPVPYHPHSKEFLSNI